MKNATSNRFDFIDLLKGFGIFLVVWGHTMTPRSTYIYSFHMPLFFFLSGFVHKDKPIRDFLPAKINALYIPYMAFSLLSWLFYLVPILWLGRFNDIAHHLPKIQSLLTGSADNGGNNPIWFLTCILVVSVIFALLNCYIKKPMFKWGIILGLSMIGYYLSIAKIELFFQLDIALTGLVFYGLGYSVNQWSVLQILNGVKTFRLVCLALLIEGFHIYTAYWNTYLSSIIRVNMAGNLLGNFFLFYLSALAGIAAFMIIGYKLGRIRLLNFLGVNTLIILALHKPFLQLLGRLIAPHMNIDTYLYGLFSSVAAIILSLAFGYWLEKRVPYLLGKKPIVQGLFNRFASPLQRLKRAA